MWAQLVRTAASCNCLLLLLNQQPLHHLCEELVSLRLQLFDEPTEFHEVAEHNIHKLSEQLGCVDDVEVSLHKSNISSQGREEILLGGCTNCFQ